MYLQVILVFIAFVLVVLSLLAAKWFRERKKLPMGRENATITPIETTK